MTMVDVGMAVAAMVLLSCLTGGHAQGSSTCTVSGDPHYTTFDGTRLDIREDCRYTLSLHYTTSQCFFYTFIKHEFRLSSKYPNIAYVRNVDIETDLNGNDNPVRLAKGGEVKVGGILQTAFPVNMPKFTITKEGDKVTMTLKNCNLEITMEDDTKTGNTIVKLTVADVYKNKLSGLCGNYNDDPEDDRSPNGNAFSSYPSEKEAFSAIALANTYLDDTENPSNNPEYGQDVSPLFLC